MRTVLIISTVKSNMFIEPLALRLAKSHKVWRYSILENTLYSYNEKTLRKLSESKGKLSFLLSASRINKILPSIDIVHYHFITLHSILISLLVFSSSRRKQIATIWGSDFYNSKKSFLRNKFFSKMDVVTFTNPMTEIDFNKIYKAKQTTSIRFGLPSLEDIKSLKSSEVRNCKGLDIPCSSNDIIVCIGTNGSRNQNHFKIIDALQGLDVTLLERIFFLFPMGYPTNNDLYIKEVSDYLSKSKITNYHIDQLFYSGKKLAIYRTIPRILIQLQTSDQFSGAMQEMMYAGAYVITGGWLPYQVLDFEKVNYKRIDTLEEVPSTLSNVIKCELTVDQKHHNREVIYKLSSWNQVIEQWKELYRLS